MRTLKEPQVVIVGAGFGGLQAARRLAGSSVRLTVVDRSNHHLFQPLLYQVATAGLSPADIALPVRSILRRQRNTRVLMDEVVGVDPERRIVFTRRHRLPYDFLVLATGARHSYFGNDHWESRAPGLKTLEDAVSIRHRILAAFEVAEMESDPVRQRALTTFVVVGGGPTGVEMAGAIAELAHMALASDFRHIHPRSTRIVLLEAAPRLLGSFPPRLSQEALCSLNRLGVETLLNTPVEKVDRKGVIAAGQRIEAANVVWAAGVRASPVGDWLKRETDPSGRLPVNPDLSVPGLPEVFVIGDAALAKDPEDNPLPGVAPVALQQGRYVAKCIARRTKGDRREPPPFRYRDKGNLATIGRSAAVADLGKLRLTGLVAWLAWVLVHIFFLIGFRNRLLVLIQWAWAYVTFQRSARLITRKGDPEAILHSPPESEVDRAESEQLRDRRVPKT